MRHQTKRKPRDAPRQKGGVNCLLALKRLRNNFDDLEETVVFSILGYLHVRNL
jgi:hypothetical protein